MNEAFDPDWTLAPGSTLKEWREENNLPVKAAAVACGFDHETYVRIEEGKHKITPLVAELLHHGTGIPVTLWLNLERHYREGLAQGKKEWT